MGSLTPKSSLVFPKLSYMKLRDAIKRNRKAQIEFVKTNAGIIGLRKRSKPSRGEYRILSFLRENGVEYYREFFFKDFVVNGKRRILFYDFYLPDYRLCIEFDGEQHYTGVFSGRKIEGLQYRDFLKTAFCKSMGIKLLRIKYDQIGDIEGIICRYFDKIDPIAV